MCGIAGFIGTDSRLDEAMLLRMQRAQKHRGPDDTGVMFQIRASPDANRPAIRVGMAHNRLSVLDLSGAGHQPMRTTSGEHWICYNGEFYNSPDYREAMKGRGIEFRSTSDTEVLLNLCRAVGAGKALAHINGMFAFAYYNGESDELALCRDRAGQKPLHYLTLADGSLVYASEIPALLATGLVDKDDRDVQAVDHYWTLGYTAGERTFYRSIRRLRPGTMASWCRGRTEIKTYWQLTFDPVEESGKDLRSYVDEFIPLLEDAVRLRLLSDVPVGICLSGGLDSSLMAVMVARLRADVPAYTIAFDGTSADEARQAGAIARHLGLEHRILNVSGDLAADFPSIASWYGEPFGDASSIPMYYLSRMIRESATVALTGDGGDELFGGYHHYRDGVQIWAPGYLDAASTPRGMKTALRRALLRRSGVAVGYERMQRHTNSRIKRALYSREALQRIDPEETAQQRLVWLRASRDPLAAMQNCDFHVYMTDDVHTKVDRMSMAHALECRSPFMDYRILEWAARLPARVKVSGQGSGKLLLRDLLARFIPRELYDRPKQGFTPPWERWCTGDFRRQLRADWIGMEDAMVNAGAVDRLVPEQGPVSPVLSWMAYSYVHWRKSHLVTCNQ
jgi:asparagine synthase (glutamine-hydrolysing)